MAITLNGTTGITTPAEAAGDISYTGTLTGGTGIVNLGSGQVYKDASGNVGVGTSSPSGKLHVVGGRAYFTASSEQYVLALKYDAGAYGVWLGSPGTDAFSVSTEAGTERMRIDSSGNLLVGTTTSVLATARATFQTASGAGVVSATNTSVNYFCVNTNNTSWDAISFRYNTSTEVGRIACTSTATSYVTGSDYRLKEAIAPMTGALAKVALLKPCTYKWKVDGSDGQGFIAHELAEVEPGCVTGEKDAVDAEGKPQYQGIDTSFLVATLTAAIQEQQAIITTLTARITALETK